MPDSPDSDPASSTAPPPDPSGGAVSSGSQMAGAIAPKGPGVTPPMGSPAAQAIQPRGDEAQGRHKASIILGLMVDTLRHFSPGGKEFEELAGTINRWSKHFRVDTDAAKKGQMPQMAPGGGQPGGMPPGGMPPMAAGGPIQGMMPRGPIPMQ